ncbi:MAG TPA: hypothetical protein EYN06_01440 [Myxococcales bacterium]|nr:hypothetical protein [Myxococcales bacterium]HIN85113.1 hypothetical protein [Myxococcales bacterium]
MKYCAAILSLLMACSGTLDDTGDMSNTVCQAISGYSFITGKECGPQVNGVKDCNDSVIEFKYDQTFSWIRYDFNLTGGYSCEHDGTVHAANYLDLHYDLNTAAMSINGQVLLPGPG